jgi:hypothetical protein
VPAEVEFSTNPQLATKMFERAITAHVPFAWVVADTVYGVCDLENALRRAGKGSYDLMVAADIAFGDGGWRCRFKSRYFLSFPHRCQRTECLSVLKLIALMM